MISYRRCCWLWLMTVHLVLGSGNVHFFHPPTLSIMQSSIDIDTNATLELDCFGKYPVFWKIMDKQVSGDEDSRLNIFQSEDASRGVNKYQIKLTLHGVNYVDTGFYSCYYGGTKDFEIAENVTSLYVFVNDPVHLFLENSAGLQGHLLIILQQRKKGVLPCLPTSSRVNVTLWKTEGTEEPVETGNDVLFDPKVGFQLLYPNFYFSGLFQCRATLENAYQEINLTLFYMPDTYHDPQPFIDTSEAQHIVVNGSFALKCSVNIDPGTRVFFDWSYPNKNNSQDRIVETRALSQRMSRMNYIYQQVTTSLLVKQVQASDSGKYLCSVTDHSQKTGRAEVNVVVYEFQKAIQINFTADFDVSQPVVYNAGQDVKFVIGVRSFPTVKSIELVWERNGEILVLDSRHQMTRTSTSVVLQISHLNRSDAGTYILYGKSSDVINSISFLLEVRDKPLLSLKNNQDLYLVGKEYTLECHVDGYPSPIVWWRWKPCKTIRNCNASSRYGWSDVEPNGSFANKENVTLEYAEVDEFPLISYLHVTANHSGHYVCVASNTMGKTDQVAPFIVTDAEGGFEISTTNKRPVERDDLQITCKASSSNFTRVQWQWRPLQGVGDLASMSGVEISRSSSIYSHSSVIYFHQISRNSSGEYECLATSSNSSVLSKELSVYVQGIQKPTINKTNMNGSSAIAEQGTLHEFYCYVSGLPLPSLTWKKDGAPYEVPGLETSEGGQRLTIRRVLKKDAGFYECVASNRGGTVAANTTLEVLESYNDYFHVGLTNGEIAMIVVFVVVGCVLFVLIFCLLQKIRKERKQKKELDFMNLNRFERGYVDILNPNLPLKDQIDLLPYSHQWEFPKERLKLGKTLGQGAFGRVVKAEAIGLVEGEASTTVAVKMLKESADSEQRKALIAELKILIHIGRHLNIVNLLGAVTKNIAKGELMVIVEYCCYGNLRHYLLKHKGSFVDQLDHKTRHLDLEISTLPGSASIATYSNILGRGMDNPIYKESNLHYADLAHDRAANDSGTGISVPSGYSVGENKSSSSPMDCESEEWSSQESAKKHCISTCDLLCFAFQCARGMEYLASKKLIHRDLAARNVLLAKSSIVKICDFGLAKDCYKYSNYIKKTDGLLPIKWMAIESIRDRVFTSKSDVWSFGILLWEIFTLGGNPYPGSEINEEFFKKLKNGYRMEKPDYAPEEICQLMKCCWLDDPAERPDFSCLAEKIGALLETSVRKYYVELNTPYQVMNEEMFNNNDYLQMTGMTEEYTSMDDSAQAPFSRRSEPGTRLPPEEVPMILLESSISDTTRPSEDSGTLRMPSDSPLYVNLSSSSDTNAPLPERIESSENELACEEKCDSLLLTEEENASKSRSYVNGDYLDFCVPLL